MSELALKLIREAKESRATRLDLGNCGLTELPEELFELTWLEELMLCSSARIFDFNTRKSIYQKSFNNGNTNKFNLLSKKLGNLVNLKTLLMSDVSSNAGTWVGILDIDMLENLSNLNCLVIAGVNLRDRFAEDSADL